MVKSGLKDTSSPDDVPRVSQYRLASHLGMAFLLYSLMLYSALGILIPPQQQVTMCVIPSGDQFRIFFPQLYSLKNAIVFVVLFKIASRLHHILSKNFPDSFLKFLLGKKLVRGCITFLLVRSRNLENSS